MKATACNLVHRSSPPSVSSLRHSRVPSTSAPITSRMAEVTMTSWVCRLQDRGRRNRASSTSTGKPSPPRTTAVMIGTVMKGSPT